jgi:hypothetical protein
MLSVIVLSVVMLNAIMLCVLAPLCGKLVLLFLFSISTELIIS